MADVAYRIGTQWHYVESVDESRCTLGDERFTVYDVARVQAIPAKYRVYNALRVTVTEMDAAVKRVVDAAEAEAAVIAGYEQKIAVEAQAILRADAMVALKARGEIPADYK